MKRRQTDVPHRLLEEYLAHVESKRRASFRSDRMSVVVLDVMQYHRRVLQVAESGAPPVKLR